MNKAFDREQDSCSYRACGMIKPLTPDNAVFRFATPRVRAEIARRGWKHGDLAKRIGVKSETLANIFLGVNPGKAAWLRIEDTLSLPLVSSVREFVERTKEAGRLGDYQAALTERAAHAFTALETASAELQQLCTAMIPRQTAVNNPESKI
jgi:hypothetical protein